MPEIDSELELALNYLDHNKDESLKRLFDILKIPSISTQEKYSKAFLHHRWGDESFTACHNC